MSVETDEHHLTCKILPGCEGLSVIDRALKHPQIRPWRVGKLHNDVSDVEKLGRETKTPITQLQGLMTVEDKAD